MLTEQVAELGGHALPQLAKGNLLVDGGGGGWGYDGWRRGRSWTDRTGFAGAGA